MTYQEYLGSDMLSTVWDFWYKVWVLRLGFRDQGSRASAFAIGYFCRFGSEARGNKRCTTFMFVEELSSGVCFRGSWR